MKSSASPAELEKYSLAAEEPHIRLLTEPRIVEIKFDRFLLRSPERASVVPPPIDELLNLLMRSIALDRWVGDVGQWFRMADDPAKLTTANDRITFIQVSQRIWNWSKGKSVDGVVSYNGFNPLVALKYGSFAVAGYGAGCINTTEATSILGPDGQTYPVILPTDSYKKGLSGDTIPGSSFGVDDTGKVWTTRGSALTEVSEDPGLLGKLAGAIAYTGGYRPLNGASVTSKQLKDTLVITAGGYPVLRSGKVNGTYQPLDDLVPTVSSSKANNAAQGGVAAAELILAGAGGWAMVANNGTGLVQTVFQTDAAGNRRALVRGYQVRAQTDGTLSVYASYWTGTTWVEVSPPERPIIIAG